MPNSATVTSIIGPGDTITAKAFSNVTALNFQLLDGGGGIIQITSNGVITEVSYSPVTSVTWTISGGNTTVTIA